MLALPDPGAFVGVAAFFGVLLNWNLMAGLRATSAADARDCLNLGLEGRRLVWPRPLPAAAHRHALD
jgi:hypothetical protein